MNTPTKPRKLHIIRNINEVKEKLKDYVDLGEDELLTWASSLYYELRIVEEMFSRKGEPELFEGFIRRVVSYKRDFPNLNTSGDFTLLKRIVLAEMQLDEMDNLTADDYRENPKLVEALTKIHTQAMKSIETIGATSKAKRSQDLEVLRLIVDHIGLGESMDNDKLESNNWTVEHTSLPE